MANNYTIPRIINGCWQIADGHDVKKRQTKLDELFLQYVKSGLNTFDCADIYSGAEVFLGNFKTISTKQKYKLCIHTKFVPDLDTLITLNKAQIESIIKRSCQRLQCDYLDLVQFHWWRYEEGDYLAALNTLMALKKEGLIKHIGLTNFNTKHLKQILDHGIHVATIQVQYSLLDKRPQKQLMKVAQQNNIKVLAYGALAGGFFSFKWLGKKEPEIAELTNRSLIKYKLIIDEIGGWTKFQALLSTLHAIAIKYQISIPELVIVYLLNHTAIDAIIAGVSQNFTHNPLSTLENIVLSSEDCQKITSYSDFILRGDVYDLERELSGPHAGIMKYNLNKL